MTIDNKIKVEKLQYDINRKAAKISELSSSKINKYEYLTGEEILKTESRLKLKQDIKTMKYIEIKTLY